MHFILLVALVPFLLIVVAVFRPDRFARTLLTVLLSLLMCVGVGAFWLLFVYEGGGAAALDALAVLVLFACIMNLWKRPRPEPVRHTPARDRCTYPACVCDRRKGCVVKSQNRVEPRFRVS